MRKFVVTLATALSLISAGAASAASGFSLTSTDFENKGKIPMEQVFNNFGCTGGNISPALAWKGVPANTKSLALTVYDPDAPTGSGFWHWVVFNIPAGTTSLPKGAGDPGKNLMPAGTIQSRTDYGAAGYGGPCPPKGKPHHYWFTLFAVDIPAIQGADANTSAAVIGFNLHFHTIKKTTLLGLYGQK
jgi:Raf kinase inhibitor-like YbhB/YbcL family protein